MYKTHHTSMNRSLSMTNMRSSRVMSVLALTLFLYANVSLAEDVGEQCKQQLSDCMMALNDHQQTQVKGSESWWELEVLKLKSLFKFQQEDALYIALRPWIANPDVPSRYQPVISMLYGKWLIRQERRQEAKAVLADALENFRILNQQNESSRLKLKILNILVILDRFDEANRYAKQLASTKHDSPVFYREVFAELAHIAYQTNARQDHVDYRRESLRWALKVPDIQQQAIAYNNYGVALRLDNEYEKAKDAFLKAIELARRADDSVQMHKVMLRAAEVYVLMNQLDKAQQFLDKIELRYFPPSQIDKYRRVSKQVAEQRKVKNG